VARAFAQRRKTLRNTLRGVLTATELETLGVSPNARAQELTVADFVRLADYLSQHQPHALADSLPPNDVDVDVDDA
jgi:16S rRNA (adenine1518-N6/adenine1519-N6)-dimethyltransferase